MAKVPQTTRSDIAAQMAVSESDLESIEVKIAAPKDLITHEMTDIYIKQRTVNDFISLQTTSVFDFNSLVDSFVKVCPDFNDTINLKNGYYCVEFCRKILYEIGPESRAVKQTVKKDKAWRFKFFGKNSDGTLCLNTATICTFKSSDPPSSVNKYVNNNVTMSVKHAGLLALCTLEKVIHVYIVHDPSITIFTPLAGAIWSHDIFENTTSAHKAHIMCCLNSSSQSGGHYLPSGDCATAVIAALVATRNMSDKKVAESIVLKTAKQYIHRGKQFDEKIFDDYCMFATGGVPTSLNVKNLLQRMDDLKINKVKAAKAAAQTAITVQKHVQTPGPSRTGTSPKAP